MCSSPYGGSYACNCVDQPTMLVLFVALNANGVISDLDLKFKPRDQVNPGVSASPPAKGTAGASNYFAATLLTASGVAQSTFVFQDPRLATQNMGSGYMNASNASSVGEVGFAMPLAPGVSRLRIANWDTGQALLDLDLVGHIQLLCVDRPCLSLCQPANAPVDAATAPMGSTDGGIPDAPNSVDGSVADTAATE